MSEKALSESERRQIFLALVQAQDKATMSVVQSRKVIARRFGVSESQLLKIEQEGMEKDWPPL
jgi:hypothetical protein